VWTYRHVEGLEERRQPSPTGKCGRRSITEKLQRIYKQVTAKKEGRKGET
jgi:hypothetical protein